MKKIFFFILTASILFSACSGGDCDVDVSNINVDVKIKRFEKDLFNFKRQDSTKLISQYEKKYKSFFDIYNLRIIRLGSSKDTAYTKHLIEFLDYCNREKIYEEVTKKFPNFDVQKRQITDFFMHYKYYFPKSQTPEIYTCISAFNESVFTGDSVLGIALDKYLGEECDYYFKLNWDSYLKRRMIPEMIPVDVAEAVIKSDFPYEPDADNMLENMMYSAKVQYLVNCMLPKINDTLKWKYTAQKLKWARANEKNIWNHLVEKKLLFTNKKLTIKQYVGDAPFTTALANISAPRAAVFVGYKIIQSYMKNNPKLTLKDLMEEKDARKILEEAKYSPK